MVEFGRFDPEQVDHPKPPATTTTSSTTVNVLAGLTMGLVVALVGFMLISSPPRAPEPEPVAAPEEPTPEAEATDETAATDDDPIVDEPEADPTALPLPPLPAPVVSLHARAPQIELAFAVAQNQLAVVGFQPGATPRLAAEIVTATRGIPNPSDELLRTTDHRTFALSVDGDEPIATIVAGDVVAVDDQNLALVYDPVYGGFPVSQPIRIIDQDVVSFAAATSRSVDRPPGATDLVIDDVGALVVGADGRTWIATADGLRPFSEYNVVAASPTGARLELRCAADDTCAPIFIDAAGSDVEIPSDFVDLADRYLISPDDSMILRWTPSGSSEVYYAATGARAWVIGAGLFAPAWAPDSSYIAWLDTTDVEHPLLKFMFPASRDWLAFDPLVLGAGAPADDRLIVLG